MTLNPPQQQPGFGYTTDYPPLAILLAEESDFDRSPLESALTAAGHLVTTARDGEEALARFQDDHPDLVLMSLTLPRLNGYEVTTAIRRASPNDWTQIILFAYQGRDDALVPSLDAGADDYLEKPLNTGVLRAKLLAVQRLLRLQRQLDRQARYQAILDHAMEGIVAVNENGVIDTFNRAAERMFGYSAAEIVGHKLDRLMPDQSVEAYRRLLPEDGRHRGPRVVCARREVAGRRKGGSVFPLLLSVTLAEEGGRRLFVALLSDITWEKAVERERQAHMEALHQYHAESEQEKETARLLMDRALEREGLNDPLLAWRVMPSESFSGDVIAAARGPDGRLYVILGDATGHGLSAAVILLPVMSIFYAMVCKGFGVPEIVAEINRRLHEVLPPGFFLAAVVIAVDEHARSLTVWNGGIPCGSRIGASGTVTEWACPQHPPMGILGPERFNTECEVRTWEAPGQLALCSDGLLEAESADGEMYGLGRLQTALAAHPEEARLVAVLASLDAHLQGKAPADDVSLLLISLP